MDFIKPVRQAAELGGTSGMFLKRTAVHLVELQSSKMATISSGDHGTTRTWQQHN